MALKYSFLSPFFLSRSSLVSSLAVLKSIYIRTAKAASLRCSHSGFDRLSSTVFLLLRASLSPFQMFSEPPLSSVASSSPVVISTPTLPLSSRSVSPLSSTPRSRTSTITSASIARTDISPSSHVYSTQNYSHDDDQQQQQQPQPTAASAQHRQMKIGKYFLERTIGKGNFAVVKLATHRDTHQKVDDLTTSRSIDQSIQCLRCF